MQPDAAVPAPQANERCFLFLQSTSSLLFSRIADRLEEYGHRCLRINLNVGDQIFWRRPGATNYRGRREDWPRFIEDFIVTEKVTDLLLLGEERPCHLPATAAARRHGATVNVVEMGYLRPDWITIERDGISSNSHFPADPAHILNAARTLEDPDQSRRFSQSFTVEAASDVLYNLSTVFLWFLFPHYRTHALHHPLADYAGWLRKLMKARSNRKQAEELVGRLERQRPPLFILPLQLETDFQLRVHSPFNTQQEAIDLVLRSFAAHAGSDCRLVVKLHPLDNGLIDWRARLAKSADTLGIGARVDFLDGGDLSRLIALSEGIVTINSTVGLQALQQDKPVKVLGTAIFDIEGLTDQAPLDAFWTSPRKPDAELRAAFLRLLAASIQVRGNLFSRAGVAAGAKAIAERLHERRVNLPDAYVTPPPRPKPVKLPR